MTTPPPSRPVPVLNRFLLLFVGVPLIELFLLIQTGRFIGVIPTLALVILTGILGGTLAHHQGFAIWNRIRTEFNSGRLPAAEMVEGLLILIAGIVLLTPGLLTDLCGLVLLIPSGRRLVVKRVLDKLKNKLHPQSQKEDYIDI